MLMFEVFWVIALHREVLQLNAAIHIFTYVYKESYIHEHCFYYYCASFILLCYISLCVPGLNFRLRATLTAYRIIG